MFEFKRTDTSEIHYIQNIAERTWPHAYGDILSKEQLAYMLRMMYSTDTLTKQFSEGHLFYFVCRNNQILGFASIEVTDENTIKLHKIYLLPEHQGNGAGKALLQFIINKARSLGASRLLLNVNRHNKARYFYEKKGFEIIREKDIDVGGGFFMNDYIMQLDLCNC